jgi:hypothetical protein
MRFRTKLHLSYTYFGIIYVLCLLALFGFIPSWGIWYFQDSPHRNQAASLLRGELALSHNPADLEVDLSWSGGGVQQVWGLGIPCWQLPFDIAAKLIGQPAFPDVLSTEVFMALVVFVALVTFLWPMLGGGNGNSFCFRDWLSASGCALVLLIFPPFLNLLNADGTIRNRVLEWVYLYGLLLGCAVLSLTRKPTWRRYWLVCALAGFGGMIRPTLFFYGIATIIPAWIIMWMAGRRESEPLFSPCIARLFLSWKLWFGIGVFCLGGAILWAKQLFFCKLIFHRDWLAG